MTTAVTARRDPEQTRVATELSPPLWTSTDLARITLLVALAGLAIAICWFITSGDTKYAHEVPALDVAIIALAVAGGGNAAFLLLARRNIGLRRRALVGEAGATLDESGRTELRSSSAPSATTLVGEAGLKHYHRADCPMAIGRNWATASREQHAAAGRLPCGVCQP